MWEERFSSSDDYVFGTAPAQFLLDHQVHLTSGHTALAVADGEGRNSVYMAQQGLTVTALEFAPTAIARAHDLAATKGVTLNIRQTDVLRDAWPAETYDLVAGIFIQFVGPDGRRIQFQHIKDATKPGGLVMLHGYTPEQLDHGTGGPPFRENMYTDVILRAAFVGWDIVECREYEREVQEGRGHSGMSALIDFVARKPV
ncbi:MAG: SAM-dependent methyltransferase [Shimia sp.]|jgi:cyclopropane fatty-acyl-phospholipid synthase-like methyltransferase|uniref:SAM-dependent methyltransferase n=1 Tax=Shimia sp. TaxID=1954381 RepID=UPI0040598A9F